MIYYICTVVLMEHTLDSLNGFVQKKVLRALEDAGVFTSGGLVKDKVTVTLHTQP